MRIDFKTFLVEQEAAPAGKPLKHLRHIEDYVIHHGHDGVAIADEHLRGLHDFLLGKRSSIQATEKHDGSPSVVYGIHPQTGRFFVASKSAFNKEPKINYTDEDIERNHGHAPGLVEKLKAALKHLPGIMPRQGGVFQADLMGTKKDAVKKGGMTSQTPNTLTMSAPSNSPEGRNLTKELSVVTHTQYKGRGGLENMSAEPLDPKTRATFREHPDVNHIDPTMHPDPSNYTPEEQKAFLNHMEKAKRVYASMKPESMDALAGHGENLEAHINNMIKTGGTPSSQGYIDHLTARHQKDLEKVKTEASKQKRIQAHAAVIEHISKNREHFDKALELHKHLQNAKNVLVGVANKNNRYQFSVAGEPTGSEGTALYDKKGNASKAVPRTEFSRLNFLKNGVKKKQVEAANAQLQ